MKLSKNMKGMEEMKKTKICLIVAITILIGILATTFASYANDQTSIFVNLTKTDADGLGYGINDPREPDTGKTLWNINSDPEKNLYCIRADYGYSWESSTDPERPASPANVVEYNLSYDLLTAREKILEELFSDASRTVIETLLDSENGKYNELLWLLDNIYIENQTNKDDFLDKIGIGKNQNGYYNKGTTPVTEYDYILTDEDIKAVQKAAIWYFTNNDNDIFDLTDQDTWLNITVNHGNEYDILSNTILPEEEGEQREEQVNILYRYLISEAEKNTNYQSQTGTPISAKTQTVETVRIGDKYVIGPIVLNKNNDLEYEINTLEVKDQGNNPITFKYREQQDGADVETLDLNKVVGNQNGFYISIPRNTITEINITLTGSYLTTNKTLWLSETVEQDGTRILNGEQPLVEVTKEELPITITLNSKIDEFDLALRKYITAVNGNPVSNTREPNIDKATLNTDTTATYKHRKDPVVVKEYDKVTYQIEIYNEGNKAGYASKIIDQLPNELVLSTEYNLKEPIQSNKNTYNLAYDTATNQIILTIAENQTVQSLNPYLINNLDSEVIEIKCVVAEEAAEDTQKILTNIAWIAEAYEYDEEQQKYVVSDNDRDSSTNSSPTVSQTNMPSYRGSTTGNELSDSNYFYKGIQDDDDFEKLVIEADPKIFDLELVKFIAAVSKDAQIDEDEYLLDENGLYERAPKISIVQAQDSEDRRIHCDWNPSNKNPLLVEEGDYVLYTIRVYNAGEQDGYAAEIKDHLPVGLVHVEPSNTTDANGNLLSYYGTWNVETYIDEKGVERQTVSTNYLAKGQGAEDGAQQGDAKYTANLLRALNPTAEVTDGETRNPDYRDVQVLCQVTSDAQKNGVLVNYAQISKDTDKNGNEVDGNGNDAIVDEDSTPGNMPETGKHEDDEDLEKIILQHFDLSLRKFITSVDGKEITTREPQVVTTPLKNGEDTATYNHPKQPLAVKVGDEVIYTIRVYNEGSINGFASKITDYLPPYLKYNKDSEINKTYKWQISEDGRVATTTYLENTELEAFVKREDLDCADVKIACIVSEDVPVKVVQTNIAEISEYKYNGTVVTNDIDSTSNNMTVPSDENLPSFKQNKLNNEYVPGDEDDDDFEKIYVKQFDLALRKFITKIKDTEVTSREPKFDVTPLNNGGDTATYTHSKDPLTVHVGDVVIYTIRVYNEGEVSGYASEITDDIPEYLEYLPEDSTNVKYMWKMYDKDGNETDKIEEAVSVKTTYLSKENEKTAGENLINAFDGTTLSHKEVEVAFKVKDPNSNKHIITNCAQISEDTDENGETVEDKDSDTEKWNEGEDDQDIENVKVEYFDLSLLKFVSKVILIEDGKQKITETGYNGHENPEPVVKVELHKKKLSDVIVKFGYGITITNEGDIAGYATELTDYVPEGLKFDPNDNPEWTDEGNNVISTRQLEGKLLQPGESTTVEVIFTWINGKDNMGLKTNTAEISEDKNEYDVPDKDSTPDNKVEGEDDIDIAKVILNISTGTAKTYFMLTLGLLTVVLVGVVLIKKFVL